MDSIRITNIEWDFEWEDVVNKIDLFKDMSKQLGYFDWVREVSERFALSPEDVRNADINDDLYTEAYNSLLEHAVDAGTALGLPDEFMVPADWDDMQIENYISGETGVCTKSFERSDDHERHYPYADREDIER